MEQEVDSKTNELASELRALGRRIGNDDQSELLVWVIPNALACSHRPLRYNKLYGGSVRNLDSKATPLVFDWIEMIKVCGIRSIICLMHETELQYYGALDLRASNLVEFYRLNGFDVMHIPWEDPAHSKSDETTITVKRNKVRASALKAYESLLKPVLLHCSAGEQRSAPVAAYIWWHRGRGSAA